MKEYAPVMEASGQWLNIGDVITHANRASSSIWLDVGVVTDVDKENRTVKWRRVERYYKQGSHAYRWAKFDTELHRVDLCTKTEMDIDRLKAKYNLTTEGDNIEPERPETEPVGLRIPRPQLQSVQLESEAE